MSSLSDASNETVPEDGSVPPEPAASDWASLLSLVATATGVELEPNLLASVAGRTGYEGEWTEELVRACDELGIPAQAFRASPKDAADAIGAEQPVIGRSQHGYLVLVDRQGGILSIDRPNEERSTLSQKALAEWVDPLGTGEVEWVTARAPLRIESPPPSTPGGEPAHLTPTARLRKLLRLERHDVGVVAIYAAGVGLLTLASPIAVQTLVGTLAFGTLLTPLLILSIILFAFLTFEATLRALSEWVVEVLQRRLVLQVASELAHRLPRTSVAYLERHHGPEVVNRFLDVFGLQKVVATLMVGGLDLVLTTAAGMLVLAFYHPLLLAFDIALVISLVFVVFVLGRNGPSTAVIESKKKYALTAWLQEIVEHPTSFKNAGGIELARYRTEELTSNYLKARAVHFRVLYRQILAGLAVYVLASSTVLAIGGWLVIERQLTLGQLVAAELIVTVVVASFAKIGKYLESYYNTIAFLDKIGHVLDMPLESPGGDELPFSQEGAELRFERVRFARAQGSASEEWSIVIGAGERCAIAGGPGAGRSNLAELIAGLRDAKRGQVFIDGVDVRDVARDSLSRHVALVRGPEVLRASIADNVAFGRLYERRLIRETLDEVGLMGAVSGLEEGIETELVSRGSPLTRSQIAQLVLARAIIGRPRLLVIDRALDKLDEATRRDLFRTLSRRDRPWTLVIVTDDPLIHSSCDRRISLEDGMLVES